MTWKIQDERPRALSAVPRRWGATTDVAGCADRGEETQERHLGKVHSSEPTLSVSIAQMGRGRILRMEDILRGASSVRPIRWSDLDQAHAHRVHSGLGAIGDIQLVGDVLNMGFNGGGADKEALPDLLIGHALSDQSDYL